MTQSSSERRKSIYDALLVDKSIKRVAIRLGISRQRVAQILQLYRKQVSVSQALPSEDDPLLIAVKQGRMSSNILTSLMRGGYGRDFNFDEVLELLRSNRLDVQKFQNFGSKSLNSLRELFLSLAEIERLPEAQPLYPKLASGKEKSLPDSVTGFEDE